MNGYKKKCMHSPKKLPAPLASEKKIIAQTNSSTHPPPLKKTKLQSVPYFPVYKSTF